MIIRLLILTIFLSSNAIACGVTGKVVYNPNVIGKVISVKKIESIKNYALSEILIVDSKSNDFVIGQTYIFTSKSRQLGLYGDSCIQDVSEGKTYEFHLFKSKQESELTNKFHISGRLFNIPGARETDKEKFDTVNQALKAQPSAAGDAASGAP